MSGRIALHLDRGLGWTKPLVVACCGVCGAELARHPNPAGPCGPPAGRRCPACGTRSARRLPGHQTSQPGRRPRPRPAPWSAAGRSPGPSPLAAGPPLHPRPALEGGEPHARIPGPG